jgi:hypothetical protein
MLFGAALMIIEPSAVALGSNETPDSFAQMSPLSREAVMLEIAP